MNYKVNFDKFIQNYLPQFLRTPKTFLFLHALTNPLQSFSDYLADKYYPSIERKIRYNSQVIRFEKILNDTFNTTGIFINHSSRLDMVYTFNEIENIPLYFRNEAEVQDIFYLSNEVEYEPAFDFTVNVPLAVYTTSLNQIRALVEKIKVVGVNYNIVSY